MPKFPKAFLWDVDGVFADSESLHFQAWRELFKEVGGSHELTPDEYAPYIGRGSRENMADLCRAMGIADDYNALNLLRRRIYEGLRERGVPVLTRNVALARLLRKKFPDAFFAAVSSASRHDIERNLQIASVHDLFRDVLSFEDEPGMQRKPAPDIYLFALRKLGAAPEACLAFEDSSNGVASAVAAGIRCIALPNALTEGQDFAGAALVVAPGEDTEAVVERMDALL